MQRALPRSYVSDAGDGRAAPPGLPSATGSRRRERTRTLRRGRGFLARPAFVRLFAVVLALLPLLSCGTKDPLRTLLDLLAAAKDEHTKVVVLQALGASREPGAVNALIAELRDKKAPHIVRFHAAKSLAEIGDRRAVAPLLEILGAADLNQETVIDCLGRLGDERAVLPLVRLVDSPTAPQSERDDAIMALGELKDRRAVDAIIRSFTAKRQHDRVWEAEPGALAAIGDPRAVGALISVVEERPTGCRLSECIETIGTIDRSFVFDQNFFIKNVRPAIKQDDASGRRCVARTLAKIAGPEAASVLGELSRDTDRSVRTIALGGLAMNTQPGSLELVGKAVRDSDPAVREAACEALGHSSDKRAIPYLRTCLSDPDAAPRQRAAFALASMKVEEATSVLLPILNGKDRPELARWVAVALGHAGDRRGVDGLLSALSAPGSDVKCGDIVGGLEHVGGDARVVPALLGLVSRADPKREDWCAGFAASVLGRIADKSTAAALIAALDAHDHSAYGVPGTVWESHLHNEVAGALGSIGDARAIPALWHAVKDGRIDKDSFAVAIGHIGRPALALMVREARRSVVKLRDVPFGQLTIGEWEEHVDSEGARDSAVLAIGQILRYEHETATAVAHPTSEAAPTAR